MPRPINAILRNRLEPVETQQPLTSSHEISRQSFKEDGVKKTAYVKLCNATYPPELAEIEVGMSCLYRLIMGEAAAEMRLVFNDQDQIIGTISLELTTYTPFGKLNKTEIPTTEELLAHDFILALWTSYFLEEDDLHPFNIGENGERVDFDMSAYPIASEHKGLRIIYWLSKIATVFRITPYDIDHFPNIKDARPCHWPTKKPENYNPHKEFPEAARKAFIELETLEDTPDIKFQVMFGTLLLSQEILAQCLSASIANKEIIEKLSEHFSARIFDLEEVLTQNDNFKKWLMDPRSFLLIEKELGRYQLWLQSINLPHYTNDLATRCHNLFRRVIARHIESFIESLKPFPDCAELIDCAQNYLQTQQPTEQNLNSFITHLTRIKEKKIPGTNSLRHLLNRIKNTLTPRNSLAQSIALDQSIISLPIEVEPDVSLKNKLLRTTTGELKKILNTAFTIYTNDTQFWRLGRKRTVELTNLLLKPQGSRDNFSYLKSFLLLEDHEWSNSDTYFSKPSFNIVLMRTLLSDIIPHQDLQQKTAAQLKNIWEKVLAHINFQYHNPEDNEDFIVVSSTHETAPEEKQLTYLTAF